jgi:hypothetical protein
LLHVSRFHAFHSEVSSYSTKNWRAGKTAAGTKKARTLASEKEQPQVESAQTLYGKK